MRMSNYARLTKTQQAVLAHINCDETLTDKRFTELLYDLFNKPSYCGVPDRKIEFNFTFAHWGQPSTLTIEWVGSIPKTVVFINGWHSDKGSQGRFTVVRFYGDNEKVLQRHSVRTLIVHHLIDKWLEGKEIDVETGKQTVVA